MSLKCLGLLLVLAGAMVWFNDRVLPESNHRLANLLVDIGRKSPTLELREQSLSFLRWTKPMPLRQWPVPMRPAERSEKSLSTQTRSWRALRWPT